MAATPIDGILTPPTEVSVLTSALPLPPEARPFDVWRGGLASRDTSNLTAYSEALVCPDPEREAYAPEAANLTSFYPLKINLPHGCKGFIDDEDRWRVEVDAALRAKIAWHVARELWTGTKTGSASFQNSTTGTSTTDPLAPISAISAAVADYEACSQGAQAWIHVPSVLIHTLSQLGYIERHGDRLLTIEGNVVVPGPGYPNAAGNWGPLADVEDPESGAEAAAGEAWLYVTGPVEAAEPHFIGPDASAEQHHRRQNEFLVTARAVTIARFPTGCVFAAQVTIPSSD